jgi:hypothetical protein
MLEKILISFSECAVHARDSGYSGDVSSAMGCERSGSCLLQQWPSKLHVHIVTEEQDFGGFSAVFNLTSPYIFRGEAPEKKKGREGTPFSILNLI